MSEPAESFADEADRELARAKLRKAKADLAARIRQEKAAERQAPPLKSGPAKLSDDTTIIAAERAYWERRLSEVDPVLQAELRRLKGRVETLEARLGKAGKAFGVLARQLKEVRAELAALKGHGTNGRQTQPKGVKK